jgi:alkylhydroperoxidase/carboxymuconolactone decarboxylase family protein YurZ
MEISARGRELKADFISKRGFWVDEYEGMAALCPDFLEAHLASSVVATRSDRLSPLLCEFIAIAIDVSTTHLFESGLRLHMRNALKLGASAEQIALVIQLTSSLGVQSQLVGLPILEQIVADQEGSPSADKTLGGKETASKEQFIRQQHVWSDAHQLLLHASADYFDAQLRLNGVAMDNEALTAREKALIVVAANAAVTHLQETSLRLSMEAAISVGATPEDIIHVLRRVSSLGMHSCMFGFPILISELEKLEKPVQD